MQPADGGCTRSRSPGNQLVRRLGAVDVGFLVIYDQVNSSAFCVVWHHKNGWPAGRRLAGSDVEREGVCLRRADQLFGVALTTGDDTPSPAFVLAAIVNS